MNGIILLCDAESDPNPVSFGGIRLCGQCCVDIFD